MGDRPFTDEMNLQVLVAWPAVPFVWAWLQVAGTDGLVVLARVVYVLIALIVAHVCWRATAPHHGGRVGGRHRCCHRAECLRRAHAGEPCGGCRSGGVLGLLALIWR